MEVLGLVRSLRTTIAPIHRIPPDVLSLIPDYYCDDDDDDDDDEGDMNGRDRYLVTLTHVCRGWRDIFLSRPSLWTELHFMDIDKTRTYLQRSQNSPLDIYLDNAEWPGYEYDALPLIIPHIHRLRLLDIFTSGDLPNVLSHFYGHMPLLEVLRIAGYGIDNVLDRALFGGDLSSLHELNLSSIETPLPWRNLTNLRVFRFQYYDQRHDVNQLLDFFESTPLLHTIMLRASSTPDLSDTPLERTVSLPHLNMLDVDAKPPNAFLLNHLYIPAGASLTLVLCFGFPRVDAFPPLYHFPERSSYPRNLTLIQRLSVFEYKHPRSTEVNNCPVFQTLSSMEKLRTLTLIACDNLPFVSALNPEEGPSNLVQCPNMKTLLFCIKLQDQFDIGHLINMAKNRASRKARLWSITIVGPDGLMSGLEMLELMEHVTHVEYKFGDKPPFTWDGVDTY